MYADILIHCGAKSVYAPPDTKDPTNEEEFFNLKYESPHPITWEMYQSKIEVVNQKYGSRCLRRERNKLLQECDWIMTVDNFQMLENQQEWLAYRQQLRDLPSTVITYVWKEVLRELDLEKMNLPTKPEIKRKPTTS